MTGENGILTQAQTSKERTEIAEAKEQAKLDIMAWRAEKIANGQDATLDDATVKTIITGKDYVGALGETSFTTENGYEITYSELYSSEPTTGGNQAVVGEVVTGSNKEYTKNGTAVIPVGFTIVPGLDDVSEGLVISDDPDDTEADPDKIVANGNQFVWVPVNKANFATEFVRYEYYWVEDRFESGNPIQGKYTELVADGINVDEEASESVQEVQKMYKSVRDNGGFYIGRYEAGVEGVESITESTSSSQSGSGNGTRGVAVSKKGADLYNEIGWSNSDTMTVEAGGAVEVARGFAGEHNYETVTSTLVYGVQWDQVMRWIYNDDELRKYITELASATVGNYSYNLNKPGEVKKYQLRNIYDIAGNLNEWTMEVWDTGNRVIRSGSRGDTWGMRVDYRESSKPTLKDEFIGFRVALYLDV